MGSDMRFDYTALGDTVNLASRLEGQSKPYGVAVILGDSTALAVADRLAVLEIDQIRVKGKNEPERIHTLIGLEEMAADENFQALSRANRMLLDSYKAQDWDAADGAAQRMLPIVERLGIDLDGYIELYASRIAYFRANPPGNDWDGVYVAATK